MSQLGTGYVGSATGRRELEEDYVRVERSVSGKSKTSCASALQAGLEPPEHARSRQNISEMERLLSMGAGAGLVAIGLMRGRFKGLLLGGLGGALIWRGYSGHCQCYEALGISSAMHNPVTAVPAQHGDKVEKKILIYCSPETLYRFWRQLENLPRIMTNLKEVKQLDSQRSHWVAKGPLSTKIEWNAEIHNERANELIAWRSLPGSDIDTAGSIHFRPAHEPGSAEVTLSMKYNPPAGKIGARVAGWLGQGLEQKLDMDLRRFKLMMESECAHEKLAQKPATT
jgi:uncharacterized membrane protein